MVSEISVHDPLTPCFRTVVRQNLMDGRVSWGRTVHLIVDRKSRETEEGDRNKVNPSHPPFQRFNPN